ncbi:MAG: FAD-dependent oxidoreductase [Bacteroidales bacterium]|jgi:hypothetical protein|nr:FAD-dependent oxidoreductase [Bacteroidales bacterium]MCI2133280.1 FAD-dependent oxidoreductase [Bacteroidales bacterium]
MAITRRKFLKGGLAGAAGALVIGNMPAWMQAEAAERNGRGTSNGLYHVIDADYDVIVCGGGPAGVMTAIAASRLGAKTALIEQYGMLGGMATIGYVAPISEFNFKGERVFGGIPWEFIQRLEKMGGALVEGPKGNISFDVELYKLCMQRMVLEEGIDLYMHSFLTGCRHDGNKVTSVIINNKNGAEEMRGKIFVDCTGDADLCNMMSVPMQPSDNELQPSSFCFIMSGVDTSTKMMQDHIHHDGRIPHSQCTPVRELLLKLKAEGADVPDFGGPWFNDVRHEGSVAVNITRAAVDSTDNRNFTKVECELREDIFKFAKLLKDNVAEFKNSYVSSTAPQAGVRESRRILGVHTITAEEYTSGVHYSDSISRGAHAIDIHAAKGNSQVLRSLKTSPYVPYRALIASDFPNLMVSGRCLSCDRAVLASLRVQASCMGMGQAAGAAAAIAAKGNADVRKVDTSTLVATLKSWGAII